MSLVGDWREIRDGLPARWAEARLRLTVDDEADADRAAALLAPINPGRRGRVVRFVCAAGGSGPSPETISRLLRRLDEERIRGKLELVSSGETVPAPEPVGKRAPELAESWDTALAGLPPSWSDLYAELELVSSDWLDRGALLLAPVNPARHGDRPTFRFRVARRFGYGASPRMARRCLERVDREEIRGELRVLWALSSTDPVATQGPVWYVEGRPV